MLLLSEYGLARIYAGQDFALIHLNKGTNPIIC